MGSPEDEDGRNSDETLHEVILTKGFWMAETPVTQEQWKRFMGNNPSRFTDEGADRPVERVSWFDAVVFANSLSEEARTEHFYNLKGGQGTPGKSYHCKDVESMWTTCGGYRLPTEAEWEYACRAGTMTVFWTGENLTTDQANYDGNHPYAGNGKGEHREKTVEVRSFEANPWGLYEVHGNVWEWVEDRYGAYSEKAVTDPVGPDGGSSRVLRGGSWADGAHNCRAAIRNRGDPGIRSFSVGFRLLRTSPFAH